jgi:hypothetical protein
MGYYYGDVITGLYFSDVVTPEEEIIIHRRHPGVNGFLRH